MPLLLRFLCIRNKYITIYIIIINHLKRFHRNEEYFICKLGVLVNGGQHTEDGTNQHLHESGLVNTKDETDQRQHESGIVNNKDETDQYNQFDFIFFITFSRTS